MSETIVIGVIAGIISGLFSGAGTALLLEAGFEWVGEDDTGLTYFRKRK